MSFLQHTGLKSAKDNCKAKLRKPVSKRVRGFSLIELGLALAIIALIAGGVIKGRDMIANARLQSIATQMGQVELAINSFESRYGALPGDMLNSSTAFAAIPSSGNGNGNDRIDSGMESVRAFQALGLANLINGQFDGAVPAAGSSCPSSTCPTTATGGRLQFLLGTPSGTGSFRALLSATGQIDVRQLAELDRKLDDGRPNTGRFQLLAGAPNTCLTDGNWNLGNTADACPAALLIQ